MPLQLCSDGGATIHAVAFSPDGRRLAGGIDVNVGLVRVWDLERPDAATELLSGGQGHRRGFLPRRWLDPHFELGMDACG